MPSKVCSGLLSSVGQSTSSVSLINHTRYPYAQNIENCMVCSCIANILKTSARFFFPPRSPSGILTELSFRLYSLRHRLCVYVPVSFVYVYVYFKRLFKIKTIFILFNVYECCLHVCVDHLASYTTLPHAKGGLKNVLDPLELE